MDLKEAKKKRDEARAVYHAKSEAGAPPAELRKLSDAVKAANKAVSDVITTGAKPCPGCGDPPIGCEHQSDKNGNGVDYEVGCAGACKPFRHTDGTIRKPSARGGMMPKQTVEAWNEGADFWSIGTEEDLPPAAAQEPDAPAGE